LLYAQGFHVRRDPGCLPFLMSADHFATMLARLIPNSSEIRAQAQVKLTVGVEQN